MLTQVGFALIKIADNSVVETWTAHEDAPPARIYTADLDVHGAQPGDVLGDYKLVPRFVDDPGLPAPWSARMPDVVGCDGERVVETVSYSEIPDTRIVAELVKTECAKRIYAVASDNAQKNMLASYVAGNLTSEDEAVFKTGTNWIMSMQATCRNLIVSPDVAYRDDSKWPSVPDGVAALAARV